MRINYGRWVTVGYIIVLTVFSLYILLLPGRKYRVLTTSDSGFFAGIAEELNAANGFIERYSRSHAPYGWPVSIPDQGQPLLAVMLYRGVSAVFPGIELMDIINIWSPLMFVLMLVPVFLIAKELGGKIAAHMAVFFFSVLVATIYWCKFAAFDRDPLVAVLSAWTIYFSILAFKRSSLASGFLAGIALSLLGLVWGGWLYLIPVLFGALVALIFHEYLLLLLKGEGFLGALRGIKHNARTVAAVMLIFVTISLIPRPFGIAPDWIGFAKIILGYLGLGAGTEGTAALESRYASEMAAPTSFSEVFYHMYANALLTRIALLLFGLGLVRILVTRRKWEWVMLAWFIVLLGLVWPGRGQSRFVRQWWPFFPVMLGMGFSAFFALLVELWEHMRELVLGVLKVLPVVVAIVSLPFVQNALVSASRVTPPTEWAGQGFDEAMIEACEWLENNTPPDTVVAVEWSYGHLLTGASRRKSVCDGVEALAEEGKWENDPNIVRPPDYIYTLRGGRYLIYGVDIGLLTLEPYRIYGRRTDVLRIPYMDANELKWLLATYRDNFGVKIDYIILDWWDYLNATWVDRQWHAIYTFRSPPLRSAQKIPEVMDNLIVIRFGENRENVIVNTSKGEAYLQRVGEPDLLFDGYIDVTLDEQGRMRDTTFHKPPRTPDIPETIVLFRLNDTVVDARIYPSRTKEVEARGTSIGVLARLEMERMPVFLERVFTSSNGWIVMLRVKWEYIPPKGAELWSGEVGTTPVNWLEIENVSCTIRSPAVGEWYSLEIFRSR